ncbi:hypothetical protein C8R46DRAFT_1139553 [Mycena filopes]|nr:hypothetical protein C8R46DRAFT_1139553 [Mycena filopes]
MWSAVSASYRCGLVRVRLSSSTCVLLDPLPAGCQRRRLRRVRPRGVWASVQRGFGVLSPWARLRLVSSRSHPTSASLCCDDERRAAASWSCAPTTIMLSPCSFSTLRRCYFLPPLIPPPFFSCSTASCPLLPRAVVVSTPRCCRPRCQTTWLHRTASAHRMGPSDHFV